MFCVCLSQRAQQSSFQPLGASPETFLTCLLTNPHCGSLGSAAGHAAVRTDGQTRPSPPSVGGDAPRTGTLVQTEPWWGTGAREDVTYGIACSPNPCLPCLDTALEQHMIQATTPKCHFQPTDGRKSLTGPKDINLSGTLLDSDAQKSQHTQATIRNLAWASLRARSNSRPGQGPRVQGRIRRFIPPGRIEEGAPS